LYDRCADYEISGRDLERRDSKFGGTCIDGTKFGGMGIDDGRCVVQFCSATYVYVGVDCALVQVYIGAKFGGTGIAVCRGVVQFCSAPLVRRPTVVLIVLYKIWGG